MRVLVVDDDSGTANAIRASLTGCGYRVATAKDGREALEKITESLEASESLDLMITDFIMPGVNGLELIRTAKNMLPDLSVILMSAYGISDVRRDAINLDQCVYLEKPFDLAELAKTIVRVANNGK